MLGIKVGMMPKTKTVVNHTRYTLWHYFEVVKHTACKKIILLVHVKTTVGDAHIY